MKSVYACFSTDVIHEGHLHIIQEAQAQGDLPPSQLSMNKMEKRTCL